MGSCDLSPRDDASAVTALLRARGERQRVGRDLDPESAVRFDAWDQGLDRAERLRTDGAVVLGQLEVAGSPSQAKTAGIAVDLLAGGLCHAVFTATPRVWDTHTESTIQHGAYEDLFVGLEALYVALRDASLLDETLVVVMSEFNRTPLYNITGGKDHWPNGSALVFGGGVSGGRVCGVSTDLIEAAPMDLETGEALPSGDACTYENFIAGMFELLDVDPVEWLPGIAPFRGALPR